MTGQFVEQEPDSDGNARQVANSRLAAVLQQVWGYDSFRPLQREAMQSIMDDHDSLIVLPTGGGKSLCFQAPALCREGLAVVVSPLISLMKDQVDALRDCGVAAAFLNSTLTREQQRVVSEGVNRGEYRLLYVSPERLVTDRMLEFLRAAGLSFIAVDEAHCISQWGHDFRPEYRQLAVLRETFPKLSLHAYTATATERVRCDIVAALRLREPHVLVGSFDRPNLTFRVLQRKDRLQQIRAILDRHPGESGIIYCISRANVDETSTSLNQLGYRTRGYHAGMDGADRKACQDGFISERIDTVVATVAFGMGIDKSNVRYVIHAGMPKSLEHYQQEAGRAGRDGLEAECTLLYSAGDFLTWKRILESGETPAPAAALESLNRMAAYCSTVLCRHRMLVSHFGEHYDRSSCAACDVCLDEIELIDDALIVGQKILSSVVRQGQRFGGEYTSLVLQGSQDRRVVQNGHDQLSTWGLLSDHSQSTIRDWIEQLVAQEFLERSGEFNVLRLTVSGRQLLSGQITPRLARPMRRKSKSDSPRRSVADEAWQGVDAGLFEQLRGLRRALAQQRGVPPYIVFGDASLRAMACFRPTTLDGFLAIRGVGDAKLREYGDEFVNSIAAWCREHRLATDLTPGEIQAAIRTAADTRSASGDADSGPVLRHAEGSQRAR